MATAAVPQVTDIPPFPALSDRTEGNYNAMAYAFGSHMSTKFKPELVAVAANVLQNANEAVAKAAAASEAAAVAAAAVNATRDAAADAASALASKQAAASSASVAAQSATSAQQAKQSVDQSLASVAGGPVISINGLTGVVNIKVPTTGDVVVSARGDYNAPQYLPCDGGTYLRSSYRDLAAMIPIEYPATKMTAPGQIPGASARAVAFSRDSIYLAVGSAETDGLKIYKRAFAASFSPLNLTGSVNNNGLAVDFSFDGAYVAAVGTPSDGSTSVTVYKRSGDVFTRLSSPAVAGQLGGATAYAVAFSPNGSFLAVGSSSGTFPLSIYGRSGDVFTRQANPAVVPTTTVNTVAFSPDSTYLAVGVQANTNNLIIYKRSGSTFTKLPDPDVMPGGTVESIAFSPDGNYMAVANRGTSRLLIYQRNGDTFSLVATPNAGTVFITCVAFSPNGNYLAAALGGNLPSVIFRQTGNGFARVATLDGAPALVNGVAFSGDSLTLALANDNTPYITTYRVEYDTNTRFKLPTQSFDGSGLLGYIKT